MAVEEVGDIVEFGVGGMMGIPTQDESVVDVVEGDVSILKQLS